MILFLDFDGVLHPSGTTDSYFCNMPLLESFMLQHRHLKVVVTSIHRKKYPFEAIVNFFPPSIQSRVIGVTPISDKVSDKYKDVHKWMEINRYNGPWLVVDDNLTSFPEDYKNAIKITPSTGLTKADIGFMNYLVGQENPSRIDE